MKLSSTTGEEIPAGFNVEEKIQYVNPQGIPFLIHKSSFGSGWIAWAGAGQKRWDASTLTALKPMIEDVR